MQIMHKTFMQIECEYKTEGSINYPADEKKGLHSTT